MWKQKSEKVSTEQAELEGMPNQCPTIVQPVHPTHLFLLLEQNTGALKECIPISYLE